MDARGVDIRFFRRGLKVWIRNPYKEGDDRYRSKWLPREVSGRPLWVPGEVLTVEARDRAPEISVQTALTPRVPLVVPVREILPMDEVLDVDDVTEFNHLHDAGIVYTLQRRFLEARPYTRAGNLLISINPFRVVADDEGIAVVDPVYMYRYRHRPPKHMLDNLPASKRELHELPPHVFDIAQQAYTTVIDERLSQYICMLGESGSGKTEASRHILTYLLYSAAEERLKLEMHSNGAFSPRAQSRHGRGLLVLRAADVEAAKRDSQNRHGRYGSVSNPFYHTGLDEIERRVLAAEIVLDAFGTAGTAANSRSSRHARLTRVFFRGDGRVLRSQYSAVLLDAHRTSHLQSEADLHTATQRIDEFNDRSPLLLHTITNFSVFYFMLAGLDASTRAQLALDTTDPTRYRYLGCFEGSPRTAEEWELFDSAASGHAAMEVVYAEEFRQLVDALAESGIHPSEHIQIWRTLAGILHLGNVDFACGDRSVNKPATPNPVCVRKAAAALQVSSELLSAALVGTLDIKTLLSGQSQSTTLHTPKSSPIYDDKTAESAISSFCAVLYEQLHDWLVARLNQTQESTTDPNVWQSEIEALPFGQQLPLHIGLIDCPGFDLRPGDRQHGLSQLLINHFGERLHSAYLDATFLRERDVFDREKVDGSHIQFINNAEILQAVDNPRTGVLSIIEEAHQYKRGNASSVATKLHNMLKRNPAYQQSPSSNPKENSSQFSLHHTASTVLYNVKELMGGNSEVISAQLCALLTQAQSGHLLRRLIHQLLSSSSHGPTNASISSTSTPDQISLLHSICNSTTSSDGILTRPPVSIRITRGLDEILSPFIASSPWFIRCIRPNVKRRAVYTEPGFIAHQLHYSCVLQATALRHSGYSYRTTFEDFYSRFILVAPPSENLIFPPPPYINMRALCKELLQQLLSLPIFEDMDLTRSVQLGINMIFLRKHIIDTLESLREVRLQAMDRVAVRLQAIFRGYIARRALHHVDKGVCCLQAAWKTKVQRDLWLRRVNAIRTIQFRVLGWLAYTKYSRLRAATLQIQGWYRQNVQRAQFRRVRHGVRLLHTLARGYIVRQHVLAMLECVVKLQRFARKFLNRSRAWRTERHAVVAIQSAWRGFWTRVMHEAELTQLVYARAERWRWRQASKIKACWRTALTRRRYLEFRTACKLIQQFVRSRFTRQRYNNLRNSTIVAQAIVRGHLARRRARKLRNYLYTADTLWQIRQWRLMELRDLLDMNSPEAILGVSSHHNKMIKMHRNVSGSINTLEKGGSKSGSVAPHSLNTMQLTTLLDIDAELMLKDAFPRGFVRAYDDLSTTLIDHGRKIVSIDIGAAHCAALADNGHLYTWGIGDSGQCGHGSFKGSKTPVRVEALATGEGLEALYAAHSLDMNNGVVPFSHTGSHTISSKSKTIQHEQISQSSSRSVLRATRRNILKGVRITSIACGESHTLAVTDGGNLFSWGDNRRGQVGVENSFQPVSTPVPLNTLGRKVTAVAAGDMHSLALLNSGTVLSWGMGSVTGHGKLKHDLECTDVTVPSPIQGLANVRVRQVSSGSYFSAVLTSAGAVYTWGKNDLGECGHGHRDFVYTPLRVDGIRDAAAEASILVNRMQRNASSNSVQPHGQPNSLNIDSSPMHGTDTITDNLSVTQSTTLGKSGATTTPSHARVAQLSCGRNHMICVSSTGRVYSWGRNDTGQLGLGDLQTRLSPNIVHRLLQRRVVTVFATAHASYAITDYHEVLVWGASLALHSPILFSNWCTSAPSGSTSVDTDSTELFATVQSLVPVEIPFHEVPGRTPKHFFGAHSSTFSVLGIAYSQTSLDDNDAYRILQRMTVHRLPGMMTQEGIIHDVTEDNNIDAKGTSSTSVKSNAIHRVVDLVRQSLTGELLSEESDVRTQQMHRALAAASSSVMTAVTTERSMYHNAHSGFTSRCSSANSSQNSVSNLGHSMYGPIAAIQMVFAFADVARKLLTPTSVETSVFPDVLQMATRCHFPAHTSESSQSQLSRPKASKPMLKSTLDGSINKPADISDLEKAFEMAYASASVWDALACLPSYQCAGLTTPQFWMIFRRLCERMNEDETLLSLASPGGHSTYEVTQHSISSPGVQKPRVSIASKKRRKYHVVLSAVDHNVIPLVPPPPVAPGRVGNNTNHIVAGTMSSITRTARLNSPEDTRTFLRMLQQPYELNDVKQKFQHITSPINVSPPTSNRENHTYRANEAVNTNEISANDSKHHFTPHSPEQIVLPVEESFVDMDQKVREQSWNPHFNATGHSLRYVGGMYKHEKMQKTPSPTTKLHKSLNVTTNETERFKSTMDGSPLAFDVLFSPERLVKANQERPSVSPRKQQDIKPNMPSPANGVSNSPIHKQLQTNFTPVHSDSIDTGLTVRSLVRNTSSRTSGTNMSNVKDSITNSSQKRLSQPNYAADTTKSPQVDMKNTIRPPPARSPAMPPAMPSLEQYMEARQAKNDAVMDRKNSISRQSELDKIFESIRKEAEETARSVWQE